MQKRVKKNSRYRSKPIPIRKPDPAPKTKTMELQERMQNLEDRLILLQNRVTAIECMDHKHIQDLIEASYRELRVAGKIK